VPTYQYACKQPACGHRFEAVQSFSDDPIALCPVCEGQVRKVFSAVGVVFKGSGFYRNDSREPAKSGSNGASVKDSGSKDGGSKDNGSKDGGSGEKKADSSSSTASSSSSDSSGSGSSSGSASKSSTSGSSSGSTSTAAAS
jgi:putative FmdB family regulatory protein